METARTKGYIFAALACLLGFFLFAPPPASAAFTKYIDFAIDATHPESASISFAGGENDPLIGTDISIDTVQGYYNMSTTTTPLYAISGGLLSFVTGDFTALSNNVWTFDDPNPGNHLTITGGVHPAGNPGWDIPDGTVLVSGTFTSARVMKIDESSYSVVFGSFVDTKNNTLVNALFGWIPPGFKGNLNLTFDANSINGIGFQSYEIYDGHVKNTPVPIPGTVWLLGSGLLGFFGIRRRK